MRWSACAASAASENSTRSKGASPSLPDRRTTARSSRGPWQGATASSYDAAMEAGYRDNGPPGERSVYHEGYYGAFVLDPDGNNVEAVFHDR